MSNEEIMVKAGGVASIAAALLFISIYVYLSLYFNYPGILLENAATVLPNLLAMDNVGRLIWALYSLLPLLFIPLGIATYLVLRQESNATMMLAKIAAIIAGVTIMLGLVRWPSIQWQLAEQYIIADESQRETIRTIFSAVNIFIGNYIGDFVGEFCLSMFLVLTGFGILGKSNFKKWVGYLCIFTGIVLYVGVFRNVAGIELVVSKISYVSMILPVCLIALGTELIRYKKIIQE